MFWPSIFLLGIGTTYLAANDWENVPAITRNDHTNTHTDTYYIL